MGLAARSIETDVDQYETRKWPRLSETAKSYPPRWPDKLKEGKKFAFMSLDGGLIDNEPFEYARRAIMRDGEENKTGESNVKGAVVMIDPFPEPPAFSLKEVREASIFDVVRALFPMLKNQARFKPDALATAFDNTNYSRWMISPSRTVAGTHGEKNERYAIATGVLGGFGGFLDEVVPRARLPARPSQLPEVPARHLLGRRRASVRQGLAGRRRRQFRKLRQG